MIFLILNNLHFSLRYKLCFSRCIYHSVTDTERISLDRQKLSIPHMTGIGAWHKSIYLNTNCVRDKFRIVSIDYFIQFYTIFMCVGIIDSNCALYLSTNRKFRNIFAVNLKIVIITDCIETCEKINAEYLRSGIIIAQR